MYFIAMSALIVNRTKHSNVNIVTDGFSLCMIALLSATSTQGWVVVEEQCNF